MHSTNTRYPVCRHALAALPSLVMLAALFLIFPSEASIYTYFQQLKDASPLATRVFKGISDYGGIPFFICYALLLYAAIRHNRPGSRRFVFSCLVAFCLALAANRTLKFAIGWPRPGIGGEPMPFSSEDSHHSLPSGHMTESVVTALPLALRFGRFGLPLLAGIVNAAMGFSRIFLGRHHPADILASLIVGGVFAYAAWRIERFKFFTTL